MADLFEFLKASDDPAHDQLIFMKAQIAFWLLGAIDGHAKYFSVFLQLAYNMAELALDQISDRMPDAIATVCKSLPKDFPEAVRDSIAEGALKRCGIIAEASEQRESIA